MKRKIILGLVIGLVAMTSAVSIFAAGEKESEQKESGKIKVALLLPGSITDQGWNWVAYNALMAVEKEVGAEVAYTERTPASDYEEIFRGYAVAGYDIIMGHGFEFGDAAKKVAKDFPDKYFIVTSTNISQQPNVASFVINDPQSGFLQGYIAALLSETGKVGTIGGMEIPPIINQQKGFEAGAKYYNPDVKVTMVLTGSFHDVAKGKEMAKALIDTGIDILAADADETNLGVIEAARDAGIQVIGSSADLGAENKDVTITSVLEDFSRVFILLTRKVVDGKFEAAPLQMGMEEGVVYLAPFRGKRKLTADEKQKIDTLVNDLKSGKIDVSKYLVY